MTVIYILVAAAAAAGAAFYGRAKVARIRADIDEMTPDERLAFERRNAAAYSEYFATERGETLAYAQMATLYRGPLLPGGLPSALEDKRRDGPDIYLGLTDRGRLLMVHRSGGFAEAVAARVNLITRELPERTVMKPGFETFPGGRTTRRSSPFHPPLDLIVAEVPEAGTFGLWMPGEAGLRFNDHPARIR